jgi:Tyrosine phosphatase family
MLLVRARFHTHLMCGHMQVISSTLEQKRPLMFYCKAGKDRTGLLAMLLLSVAGASDDQIIEDYFHSDQHGQTALGNLAGRRDLQKLDKEKFSRAPREVMEGTLASIRFVPCVSSCLLWVVQAGGVHPSILNPSSVKTGFLQSRHVISDWLK